MLAKMLKTNIKVLAAVVLLALVAPGCSDPVKEIITDIINSFATGWLQSDEKLDEIENDINPVVIDSTNRTMPAKVDLLNRFPPIGDQGQYGTCVAWAVGYNMRTYIHAVDNNLTTATLSQTENQFSPKDLFWALPSSKKGANCNGTNFEPAFDVMQARGVATLKTVPYTSLGGCNSTPAANWTQEANNFKIRNYRKIAVDVNTIKTYLAQGRPVVIGAKLGQNFMNWNNDNVISSDFAGNVGQHAYHAMIVSGYDDSKGPRGAFRVVNSWSPSWGDKGYIWVDYKFFKDDFTFCAFIASGKVENPDPDGDNQVNSVMANATDLVAWELIDHDDPEVAEPRTRSIQYNVFNAGDQTIRANSDWAITYIYYNAFDANDWGLLLYDYYTDDYDNAEHNGPLENGPALSGNWWNNIDVQGGQSVAQALFGGTDSRFQWQYTMPGNVTGKYYLVLIADGFDKIPERNEDNNYYFATSPTGGPLDVTNGVIATDFGKNGSSALGSLQNFRPARYAPSPAGSAINANHLNTYSPAEIRAMLRYHRKSGALASKVQEFKEKNPTAAKKMRIKANY